MEKLVAKNSKIANVDLPHGSGRFIVITSIFPPTKAIVDFSKIPGYRLIVVGDKKTPADWSCKQVTYLPLKEQEQLGFAIEKHLPYNHYCRKLIGYLYAIKNGAELIVDSDDDNYPYKYWAFPPSNGKYRKTPDGLDFVNIYRYYTDMKIWPRGFPLEAVSNKKSWVDETKLKTSHCNVGIWQSLVDGEPDVDAIFRMLFNKQVRFSKRVPIVLGRQTVCPFNSQNTAFRKDVFVLLYLPCFVNFRFTDILRGLVAQPILWKHGIQVGFTKATVFQQRNPHSNIKDFESEIPCYLYAQTLVDIVQTSLKPNCGMEEDLLNAYTALRKAGIVGEKELVVLKYWIKDVNTLCSA